MTDSGRQEETGLPFTEAQLSLIHLPPDAKAFLSGKSGSGKTSAGVARVRYLLDHAEAWPQVLVFTPNRASAKPYTELISHDGLRAQSLSYNSFIQRSLELFWPLISEAAGFSFPNLPPQFLTIETAQILMAHLIDPKMQSGYFSALSIPASRIYNQVMISLHKCASAEIPYETYATRMKSSWSGDSSLLPIFDQAQECGELFRRACLEHNLLDYSLQVEIFNRCLFPQPVYRDWLREKQLHFVFDNAEEEVPAAHHFARELIGFCRSALIITDTGGGFRNFLGCDPQSAESLRDCCGDVLEFNGSFICSAPVAAMERVLSDPAVTNKDLAASPRQAFHFSSHHQYPDMIKAAAADTAKLIRQRGVPPSEIVIIAPLVSDVLYTSMERELRERGVPVYLHRPSRPLISEAVTKSLLTLCALIRPQRGLQVRLLDIVQMLQTFIPALDPLRGHILVGRAFAEKAADGEGSVSFLIKPFSGLPDTARERITPLIGGYFEMMRLWIEKQRTLDLPPDQLIGRFFNEVLVREGFNAQEETNLGVKKVIESAGKFRRVLDHLNSLGETRAPALLDWDDFFKLVGLGMVAAQYYEEWFSQPKDSVLISLTSAYISMNRAVDYQIWLNAGSPRWWERFYSQLTNDVVLGQNWSENETWNAEQEMRYNDENMLRQVCGLLRHCRRQAFVYASELNESGQDQKSKLLYIFSELAYRFDRDKPSEPPLTFNFPFEIREDQAVYPGINDADFYPGTPPEDPLPLEEDLPPEEFP